MSISISIGSDHAGFELKNQIFFGLQSWVLGWSEPLIALWGASFPCFPSPK